MYFFFSLLHFIVNCLIRINKICQYNLSIARDIVLKWKKNIYYYIYKLYYYAMIYVICSFISNTKYQAEQLVDTAQQNA